MENKLKISIIGLGLIGGSMAKALNKYTHHEVYGYDIDNQTQKNALADGTIHGIATKSVISECDVTIICLYAQDIIPFIASNASIFKKGSVVMDFCGIKEGICEEGFKLSRENGFVFIGGHPMAGKEVYGYSASDPDLFSAASMILCPETKNPPKREIEIISQIFSKIGFNNIVCSTPERHDKIIAFTSQLAHIVSSSYIKSDTSRYNFGFSAGSYRDLTRVAKMNEKMWSGLFLLNKNNLIFEIDTLIQNLNEYKSALENNDGEMLTNLINEGTNLKSSDLV